MNHPLIEPLESRIAPAAVFTITAQSPNTVQEGNSGEREVIFTVHLTEALATTATVTYSSADGLAIAPGDYTAVAGTLIFLPGETAKPVSVFVKGDTIPEVNETFRVKLDSSTGAPLGSFTQKTATMNIIDDDQLIVSIDDVTTVEGDSGTSTATFHVTLSNAFPEEVTVTVGTQSGTATNGTDFTTAMQTTVITFPPNVTSQDFTVQIVGDLVFEGDETYQVNLSSPTKAVVGKGVGIGTIKDDDNKVNVADVSRLEGNNGDTLLTFNVTLSDASTQPVTVNFETQDGTATSTGATKDFDARTGGVLTFAPGVTTMPVSITIHGDTLGEPDENFFLKLTGATNAKIIRAQATGTILNDEPVLRIDDVQIVEGDAGTKQAIFTVTMENGPLTGNVTVDVKTEDGTATVADSDYTAFPLTTLTFFPGQTTKQVIVPIIGDKNSEGNEQFIVRLTNASANATVVRDIGTGTILSDDSIMRIGDARIVEGASGTSEAVFTVTLENGPLTENVTVNFATQDGNATSSGATKDYDAKAGTLTFAPGQTTQEIRVTINGDATPEANETFQVKLTNPSANTTVANGTGTGTILNDDGSFFTIGDMTIVEGDSGFSDMIFLVQLSAAAGAPVTLDVRTAPGSASSSGANADFTALTTTQITFNTGETQKLVKVQIRGDLIKEGTETFSVLLSNLVTSGTGIVTILDDTAIGTINDNNDPTPTVSVGAASVAEGNAGTSVLRFPVTLSQPAGSAVTASFSTHADGGGAHPATVGADYAAVANGTVTFAPGESTAFIEIPIVGDTVDEFDETFGVTLSSPVGATLGTAEAIGTIQNDEVTVSIGNFSLAEGNNGATTFVFPVSLTTPNGVPITNAVTVNFASFDNSAISGGANNDFVAVQGSLTFTPGGARTQNVSVTVNGDARFEGDEQFFVKLVSSVNAAISNGNAVGTILDDDPVTISISDGSITEGGANNFLSFVVSLDRVSDLPVTVRASTQDGSALSTSDFSKVTNQLITIPAGQTSATLPVQITDDSDDEVVQTFTVNLSGATTATILDGTATGTITDDDFRTLSIGDMSFVEGDSGTKDVTFTVSLDRVAKLPVTFDFATANGSAIAGQDYQAKSGTVTIAAGSPSAQVKVTLIGDTTVEGNERFFLNLSNAINGLISGTAGQSKATIVDDESQLRLVPVGSATVAEDGGTFAEFTVERSGDKTQAVSVQFETRDGTAVSSGTFADFKANAGTISFAAGSSTASGTIKVAIFGDQNYEFDETLNVRLFNPVNAAVLNANVPDTETTSTATIINNDSAPTLSIVAVDPQPLVEGDAGTTQPMAFTVRLSAANEREDVTVDFTTLDVTANSKASTTALLQDYVGTGTTPGHLTFAKGTIEQPINIVINGDNRDEADEETFQVNLSNSANANIVVGTATGTIADNDAAPTISFSQTTPFAAPEGNSGTTNAVVTLRLSEVSEQTITVQYTTKDGTALSTGAHPDFVAADHLIATYTSATALASTPTLFTFTVPIIGDTLDEADETFRITLSDAVNARLAGTAGTVSITDNDAAPVITINSASLVEGDAGTTDMVFTVTLSAASGQEVSVKFDALDGTGNTGATSGGGFADFVKTTGTLTFTPDETQKEIRVKINGDTFREADETFTLQLTNQVNGTFIQNSGTGTGTILNGGDTTLGIAIVDGFKVEGDSGTQDMLFTVELSQANPTTATTFNVIPTNGTAVRGSDFALVTIDNNVATVVDKLSGTIAVNSKTTTVTVQVNGDGVFEPTENFFLNLRNVANSAEPAIEIAGGAARGTIFNDDLRRVDNQTIQFIDVDGDLATVHVSHGALLVTDLGFGAANDIGGRQLQQINFIGDTRFQDADLTVTARHQPGFKGSSTGVKGDGHVNVGAILAASVRGDILQFVNGIDLGTVNIDGDLGKIIVGDDVVTPAIDTLVVRSMGRFGTRTQGGTSGQDTTSFVLGPIGNLLVGGNFAGELRVIGSQFGSIKYLQIDGALLGGTVDNSGSISFTGKIGSGFVGQITGGGGANSGVINGSASRSFIGDLRVGLVSGGTADASGVIFATTIRSLTIKGLVGGDVSGDNPATAFGSGIVRGDAIQKLIVKRNVVGGDRNNSGRIIANNSVGLVRVEGEVRGGSGSGSGAILAGGASQISVFGSILGGSGSTSGRIAAVNRIDNLLTGGLIGGSGADSGKIDGSSIQNLSVFGIIQGGSGDGSGGVDLSGKLGRGTIGGNIVGGDSRVGASLLKSGYVIAHRIQSLDVQGDVRSGANLGTGLALSGTVRAETSIGMLHIHGSVVGSEDIAAIIAAPGTAKRPAIRSLKIDGEARFAEVLAGYSVDGTIANARGTATNSDSQIGRVTIGGDVRSLSIIAGVDAGTDGRFGTSDDLPIGGTGTINNAGTVSKIAQIVIGGTVRGNTRSSGIEAQFVDVLKVKGVAFPLTGGQGNDLAPGPELATGSKIRVFEVPVV